MRDDVQQSKGRSSRTMRRHKQAETLGIAILSPGRPRKIDNKLVEHLKIKIATGKTRSASQIAMEKNIVEAAKQTTRLGLGRKRKLSAIDVSVSKRTLRRLIKEITPNKRKNPQIQNKAREACAEDIRNGLNFQAVTYVSYYYLINSPIFLPIEFRWCVLICHKLFVHNFIQQLLFVITIRILRLQRLILICKNKFRQHV